MKLITNRQILGPNYQWLLRDLRDTLEIPQTAIAEETKLTQTRFSQLELGTAEPSQKERQAILRFLLERAALREKEILRMQPS